MLLHIPNILSKSEVAEFRLQLSQAQWVDGRVTVGPQGAQTKRNRQVAVNDSIGILLGEKIIKALYNHALFFSATLPLRSVPPLFNLYEDGENYGFHIDGAIRQLPQSHISLRTDLSSTLFLCEPEDYDGGELVIQDNYGSHEVKLPAGDLILYPATSVHKVEPVTRGQRLCSFFWTQSMVRDDAKRELLFNLDKNIQSLRQKVGDSSEIIELTGHYHNLIRQWSEL